jgi:hypothetical protein
MKYLNLNKNYQGLIITSLNTIALSTTLREKDNYVNFKANQNNTQ